jgi:hypothetical protein
VAKARKPAIELSGRSPKSPLDDAAKWLAKQGGKQLKKADVQHIKRYARGIGWSKSYEKSGLDKVVDKRIGLPPLAVTKRGKVVAGSAKLADGRTPKAVAKAKKDKLAKSKLNMYYSKQDKYARTYGDTTGPHQRFFSEMGSGRAPRKEFNRRMNSAWNAEVEIGRKYGKPTNKAAARALAPKRRVPKKK